MNFDEVTLREIEYYIQALDENVGLKVETIQDIAQAIAKQRGLVKKLTIPDISNSGKNTCPDCGDRGWLYNEDGKRIGTCPCHY